jgi:hypothetical protein
MYPHASWNKHEEMVRGIALTNNSCEGFNSSWALSLPSHPSLFTILEHFVERDSWAEQILREDSVMAGGMRQHNRGRKEAQQARKEDLQAICQNFANMTPTSYMNALVGNIVDD